MKLKAVLFSLLIAILPTAFAAAQTQTFSTLAGPVKITPLYHASTLIEAGGKNYLSRPSQARETFRPAQGGPNPDHRHSRRSHGPRFDQGN